MPKKWIHESATTGWDGVILFAAYVSDFFQENMMLHNIGKIIRKIPPKTLFRGGESNPDFRLFSQWLFSENL